MEKSLDIILKPEKVCFTKTGIRIMDSRLGRYKIPYRELVLAGIKAADRESGGYYEPEITEITEDTDGELILCDSRNRRFSIRTELTGRTAGNMISELGMRAPYILIGKQDWFDMDDEEAFGEIDSMVKLMRGCC